MDDVRLIFEREDTPLQPQRGIATEGRLPTAIQVQFVGGRYPDKLLPDGSIEHIGEGRSGIQVALRGNAQGNSGASRVPRIRKSR